MPQTVERKNYPRPNAQLIFGVPVLCGVRLPAHFLYLAGAGLSMRIERFCYATSLGSACMQLHL